MKEIYNKNISLKKQGMTLIEVLIVLALVSFVFGLGIYPVINQVKLFNAERADISLQDEANLVVSYIIKDAMQSELAVIPGSEPSIPAAYSGFIHSITFYSQQHTHIPGAYFYNHTTGQLARFSGTANVISTRMDVAPVFSFLSADNQNYLHVVLHFLDIKTNVAAQRNFNVMLRLRDDRK